MNRELFKTSVDVDFKISKTQDLKKAFADILALPEDIAKNTVTGGDDFELIAPLKELILKQPDLLYVVSTFASEGANKNNDVFLRKVLGKIFKTPMHKFVDFEHDVEGKQLNKNPDRYKVVGHIYDSVLAAQKTGVIIPDYEIVNGSDGKLFSEDSKFRTQPLDIITAWVLYQFEYPELADLIIEEFQKGDNGKFGVSMEVLFSDYKFRAGACDANEDFETDASASGVIEAGKGTPLGEVLRGFWKNKKPYKGQTVYRILGGEIFFSGMAITSNRANLRSRNLSIASEADNFAKEESNSTIASLIKAMAMVDLNTKDLNACSIVNGEPSCGCSSMLTKAQLSTLDQIVNGFSAIAEAEKAEAIKKRKDVNPKSGEHKYGSVKFADEKNKKYPIDTPEHIRAALRYLGQERNSSKYSPEDVKKIRSHIVSAWKKHIDKNGPLGISKADLLPMTDDDFNDVINVDSNGSADWNWLADGNEFSPNFVDGLDTLFGGIEEAQKSLEDMYENSLDGLNKEEFVDYLDGLEEILSKTESILR